eukprot:tig00020510_g9916.t2
MVPAVRRSRTDQKSERGLQERRDCRSAAICAQQLEGSLRGCTGFSEDSCVRMAASPIDGKGGWPSEIFEPGEEAQAQRLELTCAICCLVMREPTLLGCSNEHKLCRACGERLAREAGYPFQHERRRAQLKCPIDRDVIDRDRSRSACCRFQGLGCEWRGDVGSFAAHVAGCAAGWGACGGCGARVLLDELPVRTFGFPSASCLTRPAGRRTEAACRPPCPNAELGCSSRLPRSELPAHLERCLRELVVRLRRENGDLAREKDDLAARLTRDKGALERRVEERRSVTTRGPHSAARSRSVVHAPPPSAPYRVPPPSPPIPPTGVPLLSPPPPA